MRDVASLSFSTTPFPDFMSMLRRIFCLVLWTILAPLAGVAIADNNAPNATGISAATPQPLRFVPSIDNLTA